MSKPVRVCSGCDASDALTKKFSICSGCKMVYYCSIECQRKDWKSGHKHVCQMGEITRRDMVNLVQSLLRVKHFYELVFASRENTDRVMFKMTTIRVKKLTDTPELIDKDDLVPQDELEFPEQIMDYMNKNLIEPENYTYAVIWYVTPEKWIYHPFLVCKDDRQRDVVVAEISLKRPVSYLLGAMERMFPGSISDKYRQVILALGDDVYNKTIHFLNEDRAIALQFSS